MNKLNFTDPELKKKIIKYLLFGLIISITSRYIPNAVLSNIEILKIGAVASITFAIIDMYAPSIEVN